MAFTSRIGSVVNEVFVYFCQLPTSNYKLLSSCDQTFCSSTLFTPTKNGFRLTRNSLSSFEKKVFHFLFIHQAFFCVCSDSRLSSRGIARAWFCLGSSRLPSMRHSHIHALMRRINVWTLNVFSIFNIWHWKGIRSKAVSTECFCGIVMWHEATSPMYIRKVWVHEKSWSNAVNN